MGMLETSYALRGSGTVMVASEELEPGDGWDYAGFLRPLVADPAAFDGAALGTQMVRAYADYYGDRDATTLSAVDLSGAEPAARALSRFAGLARRRPRGPTCPPSAGPARRATTTRRATA